MLGFMRNCAQIYGFQNDTIIPAVR